MLVAQTQKIIDCGAYLNVSQNWNRLCNKLANPTVLVLQSIKVALGFGVRDDK